jgi:hypothetical protein
MLPGRPAWGPDDLPSASHRMAAWTRVNASGAAGRVTFVRAGIVVLESSKQGTRIYHPIEEPASQSTIRAVGIYQYF